MNPVQAADRSNPAAHPAPIRSPISDAVAGK